MYDIQKWNYHTDSYDNYNVPDNWYITRLEADMNETINCARCGTKIKYGESFSSRVLHDHSGFAYCVCHRCNQEEFDEERNYMNSLKLVQSYNADVSSLDLNSIKEFTRYSELLQMVEEGNIEDLKIHPEVTLSDAYMSKDGYKINAIRYTISFSYTYSYSRQNVFEFDTNLSSNYEEMKQDFIRYRGIILKEI